MKALITEKVLETEINDTFIMVNRLRIFDMGGVMYEACLSLDAIDFESYLIISRGNIDIATYVGLEAIEVLCQLSKELMQTTSVSELDLVITFLTKMGANHVKSE